MRIGITSFFKGSAFSGALPQVAVYLSKALLLLDHQVDFIIPQDSDDWFSDCQEAALCKRVRLESGVTLKKYNLLIEVVWFLPPDIRVQLAEKTVMFYHYPPVFYDIEGSVYPMTSLTRDFNGVDCLWTWSHFPKTDLQYLELLSKRPVFSIPFLWDPVFSDLYLKDAQIVPSVGEYEIAICESNETNTSNCTLPLTILSEIYKIKPVKWSVLNSERLAKLPFFINNILKNLNVDQVDISGNFCKRVRLPDLLRKPIVIISHQRWRPLKYMVLDALAIGIPIIHNCSLLKEFGGFYSGNCIGQAVECWANIKNRSFREELLSKFGPSKVAQELGRILNKTVTYKQPVLATIQLAFLDMWVDFQPGNNAFLSILKNHGASVDINQESPNLIIFGPFGNENANSKWSGIRKIFFTGESMKPYIREDIVLNIGFRRNVTADYFRFPLWLMELNWFNENTSLYKNPLPFSLDMLSVKPNKREKFCAFVTSNPFSIQRNTLYNIINRYKKIDSAGNLFPTTEVIAGGPGGSGGQQKKVEFYKNYKFALTCENSSSNGYVTEKILHAKLAGCVPIYWGDPLIELDFNPDAFINVSKFSNVNELLMKIKELDEDDDAWTKMAEKPIILDINKYKRQLEKLASTIVSVASPTVAVPTVASPTVPVPAPTVASPTVPVPTVPAPTVSAPTVSAPTVSAPTVSAPAPLVPAPTPSAKLDNIVSFEEFSALTNPVVNRPNPVVNRPNPVVNRPNPVVNRPNPVVSTIKEALYNHPLIENDSPNIIVTCCNHKFVPCAVKLILSSAVPVYVWGLNLFEEDKEFLEKVGGHVQEFDINWSPTDFTDFWNLEHYGWKSLILHLASTIFKKGTNILYLDSGIEITNSLNSVWEKLSESGIFVLEMSEHKMRSWSHPTFCSLLKLTNDELDCPQYSANIVGFKAGDKYDSVFKECFTLACQKDIIVGKKWHQYSANCFGHRHDQSILTLLGFRAGFKPLLLNDFAGEKSKMDSKRKGLPFYVHRGLWKFVSPIAENIEEVFVINLEHRADRLQKFQSAHPYLKDIAYRIDAVYGNKLALTKEYVSLFRNNDFKWKKGVIGCALSHYKLWMNLIENKLSNSYLILEDDVVLVPDFLYRWRAIAHLMPADADVVFLGGVLPPNKRALPSFTEPVNDAFAKVKKMPIGGLMRRYFHFCTYSYIITKSGAEKLCGLIAEKGIFTSIDHMMVNHGDTLLNIYFTNPLLAGCFQDEDPIYQNADFNNFNRVDKFDSEIWNNVEYFTEAERSLPDSITFVYFEEGQQKNCIEQQWIEEIFGKSIVWVDSLSEIAAGSTVVVFYQHTTPCSIIEGWINRHLDLNISLFHASDERCSADISIYKHTSIKTVFRNYWRPDCVGEKVIHLPLGYTNNTKVKTKPYNLKQRPYTWSFAGAMDRKGRLEHLTALNVAVPNCKVHKTPTWNSPENLTKSAYIELLQQSKIVPCLAGFYNVESYRFYEALENGAIPIIPFDEKNSYTNIFQGSLNPPLLAVNDCSMLGKVILLLEKKPMVIESVQKDLVHWWTGYKLYLKKLVNSRF